MDSAAKEKVLTPPESLDAEEGIPIVMKSIAIMEFITVPS